MGSGAQASYPARQAALHPPWETLQCGLGGSMARWPPSGERGGETAAAPCLPQPVPAAGLPASRAPTHRCAGAGVCPGAAARRGLCPSSCQLRRRRWSPRAGNTGAWPWAAGQAGRGAHTRAAMGMSNTPVRGCAQWFGLALDYFKGW